jgi:hypothetical protein
MRWSLLIVAIIALTMPAAARDATPYEQPVGGGERPTGVELAYDDGVFESWGSLTDWSDEEQVGFVMPDGGPWTIIAVSYWLAGTEDHRVIFREAPNSVWSQPGAVIDDSIVFNPGYPAPPEAWHDVDVTSLGFMLLAGDEIFVGHQHDGIDDGIGLDSSNPDGHSWGFFEGNWEDDTYDWGIDAGIRLVLDGPTPVEETTWGGIKSLF